MSQEAVTVLAIQKASKGNITAADDVLAVEEPLEISLEYIAGGVLTRKSISVTMRTPGHDKELAVGFLFTEGILQHRQQIREVRAGEEENKVCVVLREGVQPALQGADRNFYTTSSCGVCGKSSIDAIRTVAPFANHSDSLTVSAPVLYRLPAILRGQQEVFERTGGLHASALFTTAGDFISLREDVGRHNALDKLIGAAFLDHTLPLRDVVLLLSGRASFELVQKAAMAGIKIVAAVGAPSSLAVALAAENNMTLAGFLREDRCNIYAGAHRIQIL